MILLTELSTGAEIQIGDTVKWMGDEVRLVGLFLSIEDTIIALIDTDISVNRTAYVKDAFAVPLSELNLKSETKYV